MGWAGGDDVRQVAVQCGRVEEARAGAVPVQQVLFRSTFPLVDLHRVLHYYIF